MKKNSPKKSAPKKRGCHILSKDANMNIRAVFLHVMADALGSVVVIISALINKYQEQLQIKKDIVVLIDPILCLVLVLIILASTLPLLKDSALILLQTVPKEIQVAQLEKDLINQIPQILAVHELHIWKLSGKKIIATAHITCHNSEEYMEIATKVKDFFHTRNIHSTTIQPEFKDPIIDSPHDNCLLECMKDCVPDTCCGQKNSSSNKLKTIQQAALNKSPNNQNNSEVEAGNIQLTENPTASSTSPAVTIEIN